MADNLSTCPRWCGWFSQPGPHDGPHVAYVGEVMLSRPTDVFVVAVTIESRDRTPEPHIALGGKFTAYGDARLTWSEADQLASLLTTAKQRYA